MRLLAKYQYLREAVALSLEILSEPNRALPFTAIDAVLEAIRRRLVNEQDARKRADLQSALKQMSDKL